MENPTIHVASTKRGITVDIRIKIDPMLTGAEHHRSVGALFSDQQEAICAVIQNTELASVRRSVLEALWDGSNKHTDRVRSESTARAIDEHAAVRARAMDDAAAITDLIIAAKDAKIDTLTHELMAMRLQAATKQKRASSRSAKKSARK